MVCCLLALVIGQASGPAAGKQPEKPAPAEKPPDNRVFNGNAAHNKAVVSLRRLGAEVYLDDGGDKNLIITIRKRSFVVDCRDYLPALTEWFDLRLQELDLTDEDMGRFPRLQKLDGLYLGGNPVKNLSFAKRFPNLRLLDVSGSEIDDDSLASLDVTTRKLQVLRIAKTKVTNKGMKSLVKVRGLSAIYLAGTAITNDGVETIKHLPALNLLDLTDTKVTKAVVHILHDKPRLQIKGLPE